MSAEHRVRAQTGVGARGAADAEAQPLAEAKISAPVLRTRLIDRPHVHEALDASSAAALTLVAAPAGYGKTTAVRAWCARGDLALAWVRLDAHDNDPVRLWTSIATAIDRIRPGLGRPALRHLKAFGRSIDASVDELANSIMAFGGELALVLDDLHLVTQADCIASLNHAVATLPANARLVVISRTDPALRLPQLRASGELVELRARDLMLTPAEAHEVLVEQEGISSHLGGGRAAARAHGGLACRALPRRPLAARRGGPARDGSRLRRRPPLHRRLPHGGGDRRAR